jgi:TRAP-type transport system periplasmic protein
MREELIMRLRNGGARLAMVGVAVTAAMMAVGCSGGDVSSSKAGGAGAPVVLQMGNIASDLHGFPVIDYFASQVSERSKGNLRIKLTNSYGNFSADAEQQLVRAVAAGKLDLGWAGARAFDTLGITAFQAMQAPMLIDNYPLEQAVIATDMPGQMMQSLDKIGVRGLGVLADGLRKPVAVNHPLLGASEWQGITFSTVKSQSQALAIRALGATPMEVIGPNRRDALSNGELQGFEMSLLNYQVITLPQFAPYVTANVNLWPQMDVLFANPDRFAALSDQQRGWLDQATKAAIGRSVALADQDAQSLTNSCHDGARFANASKNDLTSLRKAFAPVYASLNEDSQTRAFIQQIQELKRSTPAGTPLNIPAECAGKAPARASKQAGSAPASLNGTYRYVLTKDDARKFNDAEIDQFPHVDTVRLRDGQAKGGCFEGGATYSVTENRITFDVPQWGYTLTFTFVVDGKGNLHLTAVQPMDRGDELECGYEPWIKIG